MSLIKLSLTYSQCLQFLDPTLRSNKTKTPIPTKNIFIREISPLYLARLKKKLCKSSNNQEDKKPTIQDQSQSTFLKFDRQTASKIFLLLKVNSPLPQANHKAILPRRTLKIGKLIKNLINSTKQL